MSDGAKPYRYTIETDSDLFSNGFAPPLRMIGDAD